MKARGKFAAAVLIIILCLTTYMWYTNRGPFQGNSVPGVPTGHIMVDQPQRSHIDLLFSEYGGVSYNFFGEGISVYIAYYERDELVLRELVTGIGIGSAGGLSGSLIWGITTEDNSRRELRLRINNGGSVGLGHFDFSQIDFQANLMVWAAATITDRSLRASR